MLNDVKQLFSEQEFIRKWLESIEETDESIIKETTDLMRTNPEYRKFIVDYAKEVKL